MEFSKSIRSNINNVNLIKGLFISDLHLKLQEKYGTRSGGLDSRLQDKLNILKNFVDRATNEWYDLVIIGGDVFDKINPSDKLTGLFWETIKPLIETRFTIILIGNHDTDGTNHPFMGEKYLGYNSDKNVLIVDQPLNFKLKDQNFLLVPWPKNQEELINTLEGAELNSVVFGHFPIAGAKISTEINLYDGPSPASLAKFLYTFCAHYHLHQHTNYYVYVGSPARVDMSETDYIKGFLEFNITQDKISWFMIESNDRKFISLSYSEPEIINLPEYVNEAIIKLNIKGSDKWLNEQKALMLSNILYERGADKVVKQVNRVINTLSSLSPPITTTSRNSYPEIIRDYAKTRGRENLTDLGLKFLERANACILVE